MAQPMASTSPSIRFNRRRTPNMRNLDQYPITHKEVIDFTKEMAEIETLMSESLKMVGDMSPLLVATVLAVVKAASTIVQNDIGSEAAQLLEKAFNSQNIPVREVV
jgi:hypothetical protein